MLFQLVYAYFLSLRTNNKTNVNVSHERLDHHQFQYEYSKNVLNHDEKDYYTFEGIYILMNCKLWSHSF